MFYLFSLYVNDVINVDLQIVSYDFIYLSVGSFSELFNLVFITSYLFGVLFSLYVNDTVMMSLM